MTWPAHPVVDPVQPAELGEPGGSTDRAHSERCWAWHPGCALRAAMDMAVVRRDHAAAAARRYQVALAMHQHVTVNPADPVSLDPSAAEILREARTLLAAAQADAARRMRGRGEHRKEPS